MNIIGILYYVFLCYQLVLEHTMHLTHRNPLDPMKLLKILPFPLRSSSFFYVYVFLQCETVWRQHPWFLEGLVNLNGHNHNLRRCYLHRGWWNTNIRRNLEYVYLSK